MQNYCLWALVRGIRAVMARGYLCGLPTPERLGSCTLLGPNAPNALAVALADAPDLTSPFGQPTCARSTTRVLGACPPGDVRCPTGAYVAAEVPGSVARLLHAA